MRRIVAAALSAAALVLVAVLPVRAQPASVTTRIGPVAVERFAGGLAHPWRMAFLPDGRLLVTERPGKLRIVSPNGTISAPLAGVPQVFAQGQAGLLDVALDPDFSQNRLVYLSFAEPGAGDASTALGRGRAGRQPHRGLPDQLPPGAESSWFRIISAAASCSRRTDTLFLTMGERFKFDPAQDPREPISARSCASTGTARSRGTIRSSGGHTHRDAIWTLWSPQHPGRRRSIRNPARCGSPRWVRAAATTPQPARSAAAITAGRWSAGARITTGTPDPATRRPAPTLPMRSSNGRR